MVTGSGNENILLSSVSVGSNLGDNVILQGSNSNGYLQQNSTVESELELLWLQHQQQRQRNRGLFIERERNLNISRSGSAPPTVEGALSAAGSLYRNPNFALFDNSSSFGNGCLTEEEIQSHRAYLAYYYSHENQNPRLPPPLLSREDWRVVQRVQAGGPLIGGLGEWRDKILVVEGGSSSLFSMQPGISIQKPEDESIELRKTAVRNLSRKNSAELLEGSSAGSTGPLKTGMGVRRKSFADILQEGLAQSSTSSGRLPRPVSHNSFADIVDATGISSTPSTELPKKAESFEALHPGKLGPDLSGLALCSSFPTAAGSSLTMIRTSEPHQTVISPPGFPIVSSRVSIDGEKNIGDSNSHGPSSGKSQISDISTSFPGLSISKNQVNEGTLESALQMGMSYGHKQNLQQQLNKSRADKFDPSTNYIDSMRENRVVQDADYFNCHRQVSLPRRTSSFVNLHSLANPSEFSLLEDPKIRYQGSHSSSGTLNEQNLRSGNNGHSNLYSPDTHHDQYLEKSTNYTAHAAAILRNLSQGRNCPSCRIGDLQDLEKIYIEALLVQQKQQYQLPLLYKPGNLNHHGNHAVGVPKMDKGDHIPNPIHSTVESGGPFQNERTSHVPTVLKNQVGGSSGSLNSASIINAEGKFASSLLEELKNNKTRSLELSDVLDHVVEFSMDQYGSRFIQQKLETANAEEKMKIFPQIIPHARGLITDGFGNYVIQKFFEHGTQSQRKELASQLLGHVLPLSLQMYGCRVIQKALEAVDVEQQTQMVAELNGSVMKCVRDQNGNHVIQKCIECIPQDRIQFIISAFFGQVVALSTHPYGCRVIQRVLEHCNDPNTQQIIMDEIMKSICTLAKNQYGNYVIQHVLQHGKPHERSAVIKKLAGQIVKMSQQKFASNVVEKCLTFGGPDERKLLVNEMLGTTDENEALQAMMKDPFGNYVVQKVLETCDDQSRELIVSRIKVHLNALKKYTYGKHIVSRVEKLIQTGERHMGLST